MMRYDSFYVGIVIQNNDPLRGGRVKILVPNVNATLAEWHIMDNPMDISFDFVDPESNPKLHEVMGKLKDILPWSSGASPTFGGSSSSTYNANIGRVDNTRNIPSGVPSKFIPADFNGSSMGMFSIPAVGSHVWVFFEDGDPNSPVYFADAHGTKDFEKMGSTISESENAGGGAYNHVQTLNTSKHTIQLDDTDSDEKINIIHHSGSNVSFTNTDTIEYAVEEKSTHVGSNYNITVGDSATITVPKLNIICGGTTISCEDGLINIVATDMKLKGALSVDGPINATGIITSAVDCVSNKVSGNGHKHPYVGLAPTVKGNTAVPTPTPAP